MSNEESELIKAKIKEIDQQIAAADKRLERFKQAAEKRIQNSEKILKEKISTPLEELNNLIEKDGLPLGVMEVLKDTLGKNRPHLSDLMVGLLQPQANAKSGETAKTIVKKKIRSKIKL